MTNRELREELKKYPDDAEVFVTDDLFGNVYLTEVGYERFSNAVLLHS